MLKIFYINLYVMLIISNTYNLNTNVKVVCIGANKQILPCLTIFRQIAFEEL